LTFKFHKEAVSFFPVRTESFVKIVSKPVKKLLPKRTTFTENHIFQERHEFPYLLLGKKRNGSLFLEKPLSSSSFGRVEYQ
jgi:hypothetical protein